MEKREDNLATSSNGIIEGLEKGDEKSAKEEPLTLADDQGKCQTEVVGGNMPKSTKSEDECVQWMKPDRDDVPSSTAAVKILYFEKGTGTADDPIILD